MNKGICMKANVFELFLKRVFEETEIRSQTELAVALKVNRSAITQAKRKDAVPDKWILKLSRVYRLNPDWIESGSGEPQMPYTAGFIRVPKVMARLCAGGGSFEVNARVTDYYSFQKDWLKRKGNPEKMVLMNITGNSMEPELKDGDTVLIDGSQTEILAGAVYAVGIDDVIMIKRIEKQPSKLVLHSDNIHYEPIYLQGDEILGVRIIGKVIWASREYR